MIENPQPPEHDPILLLRKLFFTAVGAVAGGFLGYEFLPILFHLAFGKEMSEILATAIGGTIGVATAEETNRRLSEPME